MGVKRGTKNSKSHCSMGAVSGGVDDLRQSLTDDKLIMIAVSDAVEALMRFAVVGRSIPDAIVALDQLRRQYERASHG
jgi:hypothetical protein